MRSTALAMLVILCASPAAQAVPWPVPTARAPADPLADLRWSALPHWTVPARAPSRVGAEASPARRALEHRLQGRPAEARQALDEALRVDPSAASDPDLTLTAAWLAARDAQWQRASALVRQSLPALRPEVSRELLVLDAARWSMARGPEGLPDAESILRTFLHSAPPARSVLASATLGLLLARSGRTDEARALSVTLLPSLAGFDGMRSPMAGDRSLATSAELDAAVGLVLTLSGRSYAALPMLRRAAERALPPWQAFQTRLLATARAASPPPQEAPTDTPPVGLFRALLRSEP